MREKEETILLNYHYNYMQTAYRNHKWSKKVNPAITAGFKSFCFSG